MSPGLLEQPARLRAVFARIDSGDQGADIAFTIASRTFREAGLSWVDLLEDYLDKLARQHPGGGFAAAPSPAHKPSRRHFTGAAIPPELFGRLIDIDRRARRTLDPVMVRIETIDRSYGPLIIRDKADLERFGASSRKIFFGRVRQPEDPGQLPELCQLKA